MRAALVLLAACSPDITGGSYLCGANASCPPNEACNGTDNSCVLAGTQDVFAYDRVLEYQPGWAALPLGALELGLVIAVAHAASVRAPTAGQAQGMR